jgi:hypothetical protein
MPPKKEKKEKKNIRSSLKTKWLQCKNAGAQLTTASDQYNIYYTNNIINIEDQIQLLNDQIRKLYESDTFEDGQDSANHTILYNQRKVLQATLDANNQTLLTQRQTVKNLKTSHDILSIETEALIKELGEAEDE